MEVLFNKDNDTICAISTPVGNGGIAVVRVSGSRALEIVRKNCKVLPEAVESHRLYFTKFYSEERELLDEVVLSFFAEGRSYTGEETVEISCHGGKYITESVLNSLVESGCRLAERGEFTYRAFLNGRIDLVQAEGVLDLINSQNKRSRNAAIQSLDGKVSKVFNELEDQIVFALANLEANIDFASEDIVVAENHKIIENLKPVQSQLKSLSESYKSGKVIKSGFEVAIVGNPNVGKSSLLNRILEEDRAIVTNVPGTTRDIVEGELSINGFVSRFKDTAGIRSAPDEVEAIGIEKSMQAVSKADLVILVLDINELDPPKEEKLYNVILDKDLLIVLNKEDQLSRDFKKSDLFEKARRIIEFELPDKFQGQVSFVTSSAKEAEGVKDILEDIGNRLSRVEFSEDNLITASRHFEEISTAIDRLDDSLELLQRDESPELVIFELKQSLLAIHRILGKEFDDQIMDRVFQEFCLGK